MKAMSKQRFAILGCVILIVVTVLGTLNLKATPMLLPIRGISTARLWPGTVTGWPFVHKGTYSNSDSEFNRAVALLGNILMAVVIMTTWCLVLSYMSNVIRGCLLAFVISLCFLVAGVLIHSSYAVQFVEVGQVEGDKGAMVETTRLVETEFASARVRWMTTADSRTICIPEAKALAALEILRQLKQSKNANVTVFDEPRPMASPVLWLSSSLPAQDERPPSAPQSHPPSPPPSARARG